MASTPVVTGSALVVIGDRVAPRPYLQSLVDRLRTENEHLPADRQIQYVICQEYATLAMALKKFGNRIALLLVGPGLGGKQDMVARLVGRQMNCVLVLDPKVPLGDTPERTKLLLQNLVELGIKIVPASDANEAFWDPIVRDQVVAGITTNLDIASMTPEQRSEHLEKRLESVTMFPSLPETQNRVAALDDLDHPKKWAEAINSDIPMKTVILNLLNSAHYSFRSRITTIEQAVSLASANTIREVVLACTVQRLFGNADAARINQFWRHSVATGFFARILSLPAVTEEQSPQEKTAFNHLGLEDHERALLRELALWKQFDLPRDGEPFTAGLLHDIGKVTIALCFEGALALIDPIVSTGVSEAEAANEIWSDSPLKVERSLMNDLDHQIVGGRLARRWGLAPTMQEVISQHHSVRRTSSPLTRLVAMADLAANSVYAYPYLKDQHPMRRLFRQVDELVREQAGDDEEYAEQVLTESWTNVVEPRLEGVLSGYDVPDNLWKPVEPAVFFQLAYRLRPAVKRLTNGFLQMTAQAKV